MKNRDTSDTKYTSRICNIRYRTSRHCDDINFWFFVLKKLNLLKLYIILNIYRNLCFFFAHNLPYVQYVLWFRYCSRCRCCRRCCCCCSSMIPYCCEEKVAPRRDCRKFSRCRRFRGKRERLRRWYNGVRETTVKGLILADLTSALGITCAFIEFLPARQAYQSLSRSIFIARLVVLSREWLVRNALIHCPDHDISPISGRPRL